jgi:hypothetical protein
MGRAEKQAKEARRARRRRHGEQRSAPGLDYSNPFTPVLLRADAREALALEDGVVAPWGAVVEIADRQDRQTTLGAETLPELITTVKRLEGDLSAELDRSVGTLWSFNGDPEAWRALAAEHGLTEHFVDRRTGTWPV